MKPAIEFKQVDILFPPNTRGSQALVNQAFEALQQGKTRAQIQDELKVIVGVANASLSVIPGHISVLMGLSGSGKSTLLRAANRLNPVTRGEVWVTHREQSVDVAHCDVKTLREIRRHTVAMMFQQFGLLPWRTVRDNVGFGLELRGDPLAHPFGIDAARLPAARFQPCHACGKVKSLTSQLVRRAGDEHRR